MSQPTMFESGLQSERTALAWRRTALSLLVGSVLAVRLLLPVLGGGSVVVGIVGLLVTAVVWVLSTRRERQADAAVGGSATTPGAGLLCFLAITISVFATVGVLYVVFYASSN